MSILSKKSNHKNFKEFILQKNSSYNAECFVYVEIDISKGTFKAKPINKNDIIKNEWVLSNDYTFPSSLISEIL